MRINTKHESMKAAALGLLFALSACGPLTPAERAEEQGLRADNGLSPNGLSQNGLSQNGLSQNGSPRTASARTACPERALQQLLHLVQQGSGHFGRGDAVRGPLRRRQRQTRTWTNQATGVTYTWPGAWASRPPGPPARPPPRRSSSSSPLPGRPREQVRRPRVHLRPGQEGERHGHPLESGELTTSRQGGLLLRQPLQQRGRVRRRRPRALVLEALQPAGLRLRLQEGRRPHRLRSAPPGGRLRHALHLDSSGNYYTSCSYNGKTYKPITTRLRLQDVYTCATASASSPRAAAPATPPSAAAATAGRAPERPRRRLLPPDRRGRRT